MIKLAKHLEKEYICDGYQIYVKTDYKFKFNNESITIPKESIIVTGYKSKKNEDLIVRASKKISHAFILKLIDDYNLKIENYELIKSPDNSEKHGYATVDITGTINGKTKTIVGDGEVAKSNLKGNMDGYCFTMLRKRTIDRGALKFLGLYSHGFYSESEELEGINYDINNSNDYDNMPTREFNTDGLNNEIKKECAKLEYSFEELEIIIKDIFNIDKTKKIVLSDLTNDQKLSLLENLRNND